MIEVLGLAGAGQIDRHMAEHDEQQNIQLELDFSAAPTGEARQAGREETESSGATSGTESPASTNQLMEEVIERESLKTALGPDVL